MMKMAFIRHTIASLVMSTLLFLPSCASTISTPEPELPDEPTALLKEETITPNDDPDIPDRGFFMGILPMPAQGQSLEDVYRQTSDHTEFVPVWGRPTPFYDLEKELSETWGQIFIEQYIRSNNMFPLMHLSFIGPDMTLASPPDIEDATLSNKEWRETYKQAALGVVNTSRPLYLSLGNEVNRWYEKYGASEENPNAFQHYISLYEEIYDAVKELSPETKVCCIFAREIVSENREANLDVLRMFNPDKMDILVITSYPHAVQGINRPTDIPDDYYSIPSNYMPGKPFGFSELAWPSMSAFGGEQGQADFLSQVSVRLTREQGIDLHLLGWAWLHDLAEADFIGLIKMDGSPKLAYGVWKSISLLGQ
jgi:acyl-CoA-binding protein